MLIKQTYQKSVIFVTIGILKISVLNMNFIFVMDVMILFNNIAIVYIKENARRIHFLYMSKDDAINIMTGSNLVDKRGALYIFFIIYKNEWECLLTYYQKTETRY